MSKLRMLVKACPVAAYAVADAAVLDGLMEPMYALGTDRFACLLTGEISPDLAYVAPYLISLDAASPMLDWLEQRLALPWGFLVESKTALMPLQLHLRRFTETRNTDGQPLFFRYWDPRVMASLPAILTGPQCQSLMSAIARIRLVGSGQDSVTDITWDAHRHCMTLDNEPASPTKGAQRVAV